MLCARAVDRLQKWGFLILSFALLATAQPDISPVACIFAAAFGYALFWKGMLFFLTKKKRFVVATFWFAAVSAIHLSWFAADRYVGWPILFIIAFFALAVGSQFGLLSLFVKKRSEMTFRRMVVIAAFGTLLEWMRLFFLSGYSWDPIGLILSATTFGMQMATLFGIFGMTFWILLTNLFALNFLQRPVQARVCALWLACALFPYLFGAAHTTFHDAQMKKNQEPPLSVVLVQTGLYPEEKVAVIASDVQSYSPYDQWYRILSMLNLHKNETIDLIVLSESAVPYGTDLPLYATSSVVEAFDKAFGDASVLFPLADQQGHTAGNAFFAKCLAAFFDADVVIGLEETESIPGSRSFMAYNAGFLFHPDQTPRERYEKRVLVPLGEYIPFAWCKKFLRRYGIADSFTPGVEAKVFEGKQLPLAISVCYEETFGHLMRESKNKGAKLLVNLSNDVWYPKSRLPMVHFMHGRLRTVENGFPLARSCNTGVTCVIDSLGRTQASLRCESKDSDCVAGALHYKLPTYTYQTLYSKTGDHAIVFASFFIIGIGLIRAPSIKKGFLNLI